MPIKMRSFQPIFSLALNGQSSDLQIRLIDLFPHELQEGRLQLDGIDFSFFTQKLSHIDFSECDISSSSFTGLHLNKCNFKNCIMDESTHITAVLAFLREYTQVDSITAEDLHSLSDKKIEEYFIPLNEKYIHLNDDKKFIATIKEISDLLERSSYFVENPEEIEILSYSPDEVTDEFYCLIEDFKIKIKLSGPTSRFDL